MVSNNVLAGLLIVAIAISLAGIGTYIVVPRPAVPITGQAVGITQATVAASTQIFLNVSTVNFGSLYPTNTSNTTLNNPPGFVIQNDGSVDINMTIEATSLWEKAANPSAYYRFNATQNETGSTPWNNSTFLRTITNMPAAGSPTWFANCTRFNDTLDAVEAQIFIEVPSDEPAAAKSSTVTFTATQAVGTSLCSV